MIDDAQPQPYAAVLWDFGGVFTGSPFHNTTGYAKRLGTTPVALADQVLGYHLPDGDHPWHRLERGEVAMDDAMAALSAAVKEAGLADFSIRDFFKSMGGIDGAAHREDMFDVVRRVRDQGLANALVTNNVRELGARWRPLVPDGLFDDIVDSSDVGVRKPDPDIYLLALERLGGIEPQRAVFLDDHEGNVEAARALGITGIVVGADPLEAGAALLDLLALRPR